MIELGDVPQYEHEPPMMVRAYQQVLWPINEQKLAEAEIEDIVTILQNVNLHMTLEGADKLGLRHMLDFYE